MIAECINCNKPFYKRPNAKHVSCSMKCRSKNKEWLKNRTGTNNWRHINAPKANCLVCGKSSLAKRNPKYCSWKCRVRDPNWLEKISLKNHHSWKGGKIKTPYGYIMILKKDHPRANNGGYVFEHILIMEKHLDKFIPINENVHHINGLKDDNRLENLEIMTRSEHRSHHMKKYWREKYANQ